MTETPVDVAYWLKEINRSHDVWKAFYWACWNKAINLENESIGLDLERSKLGLKLPASGEDIRFYSIKKMIEVLKESDLRIAVDHLVWMHLLIESLAHKINERDDVVKAEGDLINETVMTKFLFDNGFIDETDKEHFEFSKETRNQFIHGFSKYTKKWEEKSERLYARSVFQENGTIRLDVQDCEKWQKIFEKIGRRVEEFYLGRKK